MTFKELLNSVKFENVSLYILKMYPDVEKSLGWFKLHFDMLRCMMPVYHDDANGKVCHITQKDWEDGTGLHLNAYPMEGDLWEHSLTKEIVFDEGISASNEEIVACCLWHTSFYGFVEKQLVTTFATLLSDRDDCSYHKSLALKNCDIIRNDGGCVPTVRELSKQKKQELMIKAKTSSKYNVSRANKHKRKKLFRQVFMRHYYERMAHISDFIVHSIPALHDVRNSLTTKQLCGLFQVEKFYSDEIRSYAGSGENAADYLMDVISQYDMIPRMDGIVIHLITGIAHKELEDEQRLFNCLAEGRKYVNLIVSADPLLGNQIILRYATYNSKNRLF